VGLDNRTRARVLVGSGPCDPPAPRYFTISARMRALGCSCAVSLPVRDPGGTCMLCMVCVLASTRTSNSLSSPTCPHAQHSHTFPVHPCSSTAAVQLVAAGHEAQRSLHGSSAPALRLRGGGSGQQQAPASKAPLTWQQVLDTQAFEFFLDEYRCLDADALEKACTRMRSQTPNPNPKQLNLTRIIAASSCGGLSARDRGWYSVSD
jgi:hypothetical protein